MVKLIPRRQAAGLIGQCLSLYLLVICDVSWAVTAEADTHMTAAAPLGAVIAQTSAPGPDAVSATATDKSPVEVSPNAIKRFTPLKSTRDARSYRYVQLANHINALLISDPDLKVSSIGISLPLGEGAGPAWLNANPGWAKQLLHLPNTTSGASLADVVSQAGGRLGAIQSLSSTSYGLEIESAQFASLFTPLLQWLANPQVNTTFVKSLLAPKLLTRARVAEEPLLISELFAAPDPLLPNQLQPSQSIRLVGAGDFDIDWAAQDLTNFLNNRINLSSTQLVLLTPDTLDQLEQQLQASLAQVVVAEPELVAAAKTSGFSRLPEAASLSGFNFAQLPLSLEIKPALETRRLSFNFPVTFSAGTFTKKPYDFIAQLIAQQGPGSLLSFLKRLGWADSVSAQLVPLNRHQGLFQIQLSLTRQGARAREQLVPLVFYVLEQIRNHGLASWRYVELQALGNLEFQYADQQSPLQTVTELSQVMNFYGPEFVLANGNVFTGYDEKLIKNCLGHLVPEKLLLVLTAPEVEPFILSADKHIAYNLRYQVPPILDLKTAVKQALSLPDHNLFIPQRLAVKSSSMLEEAPARQTVPQLIYESKSSRLWYSQDREFNQPQSLIALSIKSPLVAASPAGAAQARVFAALIADQLEEFAYPAKMAGLDYKLRASARGYDLQLVGFSGRQSLLLNKITEAIGLARFAPERFTAIKERLLQDLRNRQMHPGILALQNAIDELQKDPAWSDQQLMNALETMEFENFSRFASHQLLDANMDMMVYGNYFRQEALKLAVLVEHELLDRQTGRGMPNEKFITLGASEKPHLLPWSTITKADISGLWIPAQSASVAEMAKVLLAKKILVNKAKTQPNNSFRVQVLDAERWFPTSPLASLLLMVTQSPDTEGSALVYLDDFIAQGAGNLADDFPVAREQLLAQLRRPHYGWHQQASFYWSLIGAHQANFLLAEQLIELLSDLTPEAFAAYYQQVLLNKNHRLWLTDLKNIAPDDFQLIENFEEFKRTQPGFFLP